MSSDIDVLVVGGGPAGSVAALWCARHGARVTLLETSPFPRSRPGESLPPGVEPLFRQLGVWDAIRREPFPRHDGHWVTIHGRSRFSPFGDDAHGPWRGFQAHRAALDAILLEQAAASGVHVMQPCQALTPLRDGQRMVGVHSTAGELRARVVVDASGSRHWLSRTTGQPPRRLSQSLVAMYGYCRGTCPELEAHPHLVGDATGWTWAARVAAHCFAWVRLDFKCPRRDTPDLLRGLAPHGPTRGADVTWRVLDECAGPGYFAVGDAASVLDPATSHGVLKAMMSGILAADLIVRTFAGSLAEEEAAEAYRAWTRQWVQQDAQRLSALYAELDKTWAVLS